MNIHDLQSLSAQLQQSASNQGIQPSQTIADLSQEIDESKCDCLNQDDKHNVKQLLLNIKSGDNNKPNSNYYLESSADEQLLLYIAFKNKVNIRSIAIWAPPDEHCPNNIKLYINRSNVDFNDVDDVKPTEVIHLNQEDAPNGKVHQLKFVNFRNVVSLLLFVADNHGAETSILQKIRLLGTVTTDRSGEQLQKVG
jgi:hypothetical protein